MVEFRESVVVITNDAEVTQIDASSLEIGLDVVRSRLAGAKQRFEVFFGGIHQKAPESLSAIRIPREVRDVKIDSILSIPVTLADTCTKSPILKFRLLRISWFEPYPATMTVVVNLPGTAIRNYPYRLKSRRDSSIQDISVPARSFFASSFRFDFQRVADEDVLVPSDPRQKLDFEYFRSQSIWIELLPSWVRYGWLQRAKEYFFRDNAISLLVSLWLGAAATTLMLPPKKK